MLKFPILVNDLRLRNICRVIKVFNDMQNCMKVWKQIVFSMPLWKIEMIVPVWKFLHSFYIEFIIILLENMKYQRFTSFAIAALMFMNSSSMQFQYLINKYSFKNVQYKMVHFQSNSKYSLGLYYTHLDSSFS